MHLIVLLALVASSPALVAHTPINLCDGEAQTASEDNANSREMTVLFDADQADRAKPGKTDWAVVRPRDEARRVRTSAMIALGQLKTGDDFYHAAFVYQHGNDPDDIITAHALAVAATARGRPRASWIAAASLDRYLHLIGKSQIYGTQFLKPGKALTQEPYNRDLISDGFRQASCVPTLAQQQEQLKEWARELP